VSHRWANRLGRLAVVGTATGERNASTDVDVHRTRSDHPFRGVRGMSWGLPDRYTGGWVDTAWTSVVLEMSTATHLAWTAIVRHKTEETLLQLPAGTLYEQTDQRRVVEFPLGAACVSDRM
jgi:hypothetical protein